MLEAQIYKGPAQRAEADGRLVGQHRCRSSAGYSMVELLVVVMVSLVMGAMAIPATRTAMASYQLTSAIDTATGAIQGARYQAIMHGYQYQVAFSATQNTFQVLSEVPPATTFSNVGNSVPISASPVTLSAATTLLFKPNGSISATVGAMNFTISYNNTTKTVTVSKYGSINVQ